MAVTSTLMMDSILALILPTQSSPSLAANWTLVVVVIMPVMVGPVTAAQLIMVGIFRLSIGTLTLLTN